MQYDPVRQKIRELLWEQEMNMREASEAIGRNVSYLHGFLERGTPKVLCYRDAKCLAEILGCRIDDLRHKQRPPTRKGRGRKPQAKHISEPSPMPSSWVPEVDVETSAGPGTIAMDHVAEKTRWCLPPDMIRTEGGISPDAVRMLRVRGVSMEPDLSEGDRLLVDTSSQVPNAGEMFVLWDGNGLVVKFVEKFFVKNDEPLLQLKSKNSDFKDYTVPAQDVYIVGKVLWKIKKV